jgi:hypothetical protein
MVEPATLRYDERLERAGDSGSSSGVDVETGLGVLAMPP